MHRKVHPKTGGSNIMKYVNRCLSMWSPFFIKQMPSIMASFEWCDGCLINRTGKEKTLSFIQCDEKNLSPCGHVVSKCVNQRKKTSICKQNNALSN